MITRFHSKLASLVTACILLFSIAGLSACAATTPTPQQESTPPPETSFLKADIVGFAFAPATITIAAETTVTWTNQDSAPHTISSRNDVFDSGNLSRGTTFSYTFTQSGTFEYYCKNHPYMTGKIIVE